MLFRKDQMKNLILLSAFVLFITGCATTTGIVKISEDTYMLAKQPLLAHTAGEVKVEIYKEANAFCEKNGKKFIQLSHTGSDYHPYNSYASAEVQFKCE